MSGPAYRFRMIDLLFGITLAVILLGLFLPALQNTRSRRRSECAQRLGELVKAVQQFELAHKRYPGYLEAFGIDSSGSCKVGTWAMRLMPYLEQEPLYELWQDPNTTAQWNARGGFSAANEEFYPTISLFICANDNVEVTSLAPTGKNSYVCNAGFFPHVLPASYASLDVHEVLQRSTSPENGVFSNQLPEIMNSCYTGGAPKAVLGSRAAMPTKSSHIRDGLTNTIAFTENLLADGWGYAGMSRPWSTTTVAGNAYAGDDLHPTHSPRVHIGFVWLYRAQPAVPGVEPVLPINKINGQKAKLKTRSFDSARPSSAHSGIIPAAMLGGSVTSLSDDMDYRVYQALMTPHTAESDVPDKTYVLKEADIYN